MPVMTRLKQRKRHFEAKPRDPHDLAWIAGFLDGEGCVRIGVQYKTGKPTPAMVLVLEVCNTHVPSVEKVNEIFPSRFRRQYRASNAKSNWRDYAVWAVTGEYAYEVCKLLLPFSITKREQYTMAIAFYELPWRCLKTGRQRDGSIQKRTDEQLRVDLGIAQKISELKRVTYG